MSILSRFFHKKAPDGLIEFIDRVYVFDSCFSTEVLPEGVYQLYLREIVTELHEEFHESSFIAFNFREGEKQSQFAKILCDYDVIVMDYPRQYEGCPLLPLSLIHHFLRVCEKWLSQGNQQDVILLHCERGGWPLLAFLLASFLIFKKLHSVEKRTLEILHREAPKGLLQLLSPLNPLPSQLRYLQYISRRYLSPEWPPPERALSLDCLILRDIPNFDNQSGCRPIIRIFGRNLLSKDGLSTEMLYSMPNKNKSLRHYGRKDSDLIKIDIQCLVKGDVVLECVHQNLEPEREVMMFRIMFNTAFIRSNILMLNSENLDILWDSKACYPKGFRAEVLFGEVENASLHVTPTSKLNFEEKGGLPIEAFSRVQELFSGAEWADNGEDAALWLLKQLSALNDVKEMSLLRRRIGGYSSPLDSEEENNASSTADSLDFLDPDKVYNNSYSSLMGMNFSDDPSSQDSNPDEASEPNIPALPINSETTYGNPMLPLQSVGIVQEEVDKAISIKALSLQIPPPPPFTPQMIVPSLSTIKACENLESLPQSRETTEKNVDTYFSRVPPPPPPPFAVTVPSVSSGSTVSPPPTPSPLPDSLSSVTLVGLPLAPPPPPPPLPPPTRSTSSSLSIMESTTSAMSRVPQPLSFPFASMNKVVSPPPPPPPPPPLPHSTMIRGSQPTQPFPSQGPPLPPPPPPHPFPVTRGNSLPYTTNKESPPPPPPPPPPLSSTILTFNNGNAPLLPPPLPPSIPSLNGGNASPFVPPPPPLPPIFAGKQLSNLVLLARPPPPPPPPPPFPHVTLPTTNKAIPPPPPPPPIKGRVAPPCPPPPPALPIKGRAVPPCPPPPPAPPIKGRAAPPCPPPLPPPKCPSEPPPPSSLKSASIQPLSLVPPPPPPPPQLLSQSFSSSRSKGPPPPPPPPPSGPPRQTSVPPPPPPPPLAPSRPAAPPPPPPPPPLAPSRPAAPPPPPPPPPPPLAPSRSAAPPPPPSGPPRQTSVPPPPPPLAPSRPAAPPPPPTKSSTIPSEPPPFSGRGRVGSTSMVKTRAGTGLSIPPKKASLKPLHWVKVTRAMQGSLWADPQKQEQQSRTPEIDISELETLFSAVSVSEGAAKVASRRNSKVNKPEKVQLVDLNRAKNCEIMLVKIKVPLQDMINSVLALDSSALDIDQVENLIKFCPTKDEMGLLKNYTGDKETLGKCEQFFLELMRVPRVESKLRVFAFKITFSSQVADLRSNLNTINSVATEVKESVKLRQIMQTILTLGNALNQGTARGAAVGFKLDILLKLSDTRARNNKMTLMHYLCKLLAEKLPELLDFDKDLTHLEASSKIKLKALAEEMQAVDKGLKKVDQELAASVTDGEISASFQKALKNFLDTAEAEVRSVISLYSEVGRSADSLCHYFGEDPDKFPFEQVTQILFVFSKMFKKAREENAQLAEAEKKKLEKEAAMKELATSSVRLKKG